MGGECICDVLAVDVCVCNGDAVKWERGVVVKIMEDYFDVSRAVACLFSGVNAVFSDRVGVFVVGVVERVGTDRVLVLCGRVHACVLEECLVSRCSVWCWRGVVSGGSAVTYLSPCHR